MGQRLPLYVLTSANIARLIGSGSVCQAATIRAKSGSDCAADATE
jgi:hypothetical protein